MQIPGPIDLGPQYLIHPLRRQSGDYRIVKNPSRMKHCSQIWLACHQTRHRITIGHIARHHLHSGAGRAELVHQCCDALRVLTSTTGQHHLPHPVSTHQMTRHRRTCHPSATGDQHRARGPRVRHGQHHFADMARLAQEPIRLPSVPHIP
ncbi:Uncharacterised protein [Mycobacterium tuberculosis]|nr:Uncharacterised protein [Mycobacterium tuberculosis]